jgi:hypothetical protein
VDWIHLAQYMTGATVGSCGHGEVPLGSSARSVTTGLCLWSAVGL